ncbi:MAG: hypothetical protein KatS3mg108_1400 [Isosphaeraceae bacterium]|nr:MAG: hypothetical protein KatS3mg108_1400 [Isosphaeraceae bacterium]
MARWTCRECLAVFDSSARLARCDHGCQPSTESQAPTLVFNPRAGRPSPPRLTTNLLGLRSSPPHSLCPECGKPTTRWVCPDCHADLPERGTDPFASIVLVGPARSGKSGLAHALARSLERLCPGSVVDPVDEPSRAVVGHRSDHPGQVSRALLRERRPGRENARWLALVDTPGTPWEDRDQSWARHARFLARAGAIVLVLDPRRLEPVLTLIRRHADARLQAGFVSTWRRLLLVEEIRQLGSFLELAGGRIPAQQPLAIALTHLEAWFSLASPGTLLQALGPVPEAFPWTDQVGQRLHDEAEAELVRWNGESFTQQLSLKFPTYRYVPIGDPSTPHPFGVEILLRWLLQRQAWL